MVRSAQNPLRRFAARPPRAPFGDVVFDATMVGDLHGTVSVTHGDTRVELPAVGLSLPYPSGLERVRARHPDVKLVVVERAPPGLQRAAQEQDINYLDLQGRGRVVAPGLAYLAEPRADLAPVARRSTSPFAPKAVRVVRALLSDAERGWRLSDLAALVHSNPGNVHRALSALVDQDLVERDEDRYLVVDPGSLLEAWADHQQASRERVRLTVGGDLRAAVDDLVRSAPDEVVVSGELAAEALAPYLPAESAIIHALSVDTFARLEGNDDKYPSLVPARPGPGQVLVDLVDPGVADFRETVAGLPLVSPQQLYVDLARDIGRGREAAEHVRRSLLRY